MLGREQLGDARAARRRRRPASSARARARTGARRRRRRPGSRPHRKTKRHDVSGDALEEDAGDLEVGERRQEQARPAPTCRAARPPRRGACSGTTSATIAAPAAHSPPMPRLATMRNSDQHPDVRRGRAGRGAERVEQHRQHQRARAPDAIGDLAEQDAARRPAEQQERRQDAAPLAASRPSRPRASRSAARSSVGHAVGRDVVEQQAVEARRSPSRARRRTAPSTGSRSCPARAAAPARALARRGSHGSSPGASASGSCGGVAEVDLPDHRRRVRRARAPTAARRALKVRCRRLIAAPVLERRRDAASSRPPCAVGVGRPAARATSATRPTRSSSAAGRLSDAAFVGSGASASVERRHQHAVAELGQVVGVDLAPEQPGVQVRRTSAPPRRAAASAGAGAARRSRPAPRRTTLSITSTSLPRQSASQLGPEQVRRQPLAVVGVELRPARRPRLLLTSSPVRAVASTSAPPGARPSTTSSKRCDLLPLPPLVEVLQVRLEQPGHLARAAPAPRARRAAAPSARSPRRRSTAAGRLQLVLEHLGDGVRALGQLVVLADLGGLLDAEALQAGQLERPAPAARSSSAPVLPGPRACSSALSLPSSSAYETASSGSMIAPRVSDSSTPKRWSARVRPLRRQHVQVLGQDLGARDAPVVLGLGLGDRLLGRAPARAAICDCRYCQIDVAISPATPMTKLERKPRVGLDELPELRWLVVRHGR